MTATKIDIETIFLDAELAATSEEVASLATAHAVGDQDEAQLILNRSIAGRVKRLNARAQDLNGQVERLEHALEREREVSERWKTESRKWEGRAKARNDTTDWHQLYNDLLTKISNKLDQKDNRR